MKITQKLFFIFIFLSSTLGFKTFITIINPSSVSENVQIFKCNPTCTTVICGSLSIQPSSYLNLEVEINIVSYSNTNPGIRVNNSGCTTTVRIKIINF
jgi:hypothetical protein